MDARTNAWVYEFDGYRVDAMRRCLFDKKGQSLPLPSRAFDLLLLMVQRPGELLDKATILNAVWPNTVVEENNLSQCIRVLRRTLGDTAKERRYIATVPGRGYQFIARVRQIEQVTPGRRARSWVVALLAVAGSIAAGLALATLFLE